MEKITELDVYQQEAVKTMKPMDLHDKNKYCMIKLAEEVGEVAAIIGKHYYHGKPFDKEHLKEELSDLKWYIANLAHANGLTLSEIATYNIEKLRKRHGEAYNKTFYEGKNIDGR